MEWLITIHGHTLHFYLDSASVRGSSDLDTRRRRVEACLNLLPPEHIRVIREPIIVVNRLPGHRERGGGWFPPASASGNSTVFAWLGERNARNTNVQAGEILARVGGLAGTGIIGITAHSFLLDADWGNGHKAYEYTILHELAHSVDYHANLSRQK